MLTIFTTPKPFRGHFAVIQRNAIRSWTLLRPACEVILMGDEEGTAEIASEFSLRHVPNIRCNAHGTPLVNALFAKAQQVGLHDIECYVNSDIILTSDFTSAVQRVINRKSRFLLAGRRWNLDVREEFEFTPDWEEKLRNQVRKTGELALPSAIDFFVFPRGLFGEVPPFAIGRPRWDNYMLYRARSIGVPLIDATPVVMAVHQNHDYSHHPQGKDGVWYGDEALTNHELAGGWLHTFTLVDATHLLTFEKLQTTYYDRKYLARHLETLPIVHSSLRLPMRLFMTAVNLSRPLRALVGLTLSYPHKN